MTSNFKFNTVTILVLIIIYKIFIRIAGNQVFENSPVQTMNSVNKNENDFQKERYLFDI